MDAEALSKAFQDFEKKAKRDAMPVLEQFMCQVAKTGESMIPWSQFKSYFMFKLEKVIDDFHTSTPEQRNPHNPNVEHIPFEEMKNRILKIVDSYNGIPFTIQRLCELLTDPKRNYSGTDKFLRGIEKNVMVVSCVYSTSEKNRASSSTRMNGVMFPGNSSLCSDSRNVNGPGTPKLLNRPKLSLSPSLSTNGLPECEVSKESEPMEEEETEHRISEVSLMGGEITPRSGIKHKHLEEEEEDEVDSDAEKHSSKRLKVDKNHEEGDTKCENKEYSCKGTEDISAMKSSEDACSQKNKSETSCGTQSILEDPGPSSPLTESPEKEAAKTEEVHFNQPERPLKENAHSEQDTEDSSSSSSSSRSGDCPPSVSSGNSLDLSTEGDADNSDCTNTETEPGQND
ncbi:serine/threonine-protein phosphatase 4 regulatory subunit 2-like isoform X2 [Entelurus aequoreus]|uniref:serine/threonine-protein phosphatase 4 regulatory subunit 2-like isoform X2 n=1 Tax=Entelurus aequoreus TaxID=161455 RepID=UPI002B1E2EBF|nr:serine/threonine-protein phosphatase 4 regulatory subunit 2-like isoform X2 [Entelurus aequoreus]